MLIVSFVYTLLVSLDSLSDPPLSSSGTKQPNSRLLFQKQLLIFFLFKYKTENVPFPVCQGANLQMLELK